MQVPDQDSFLKSKLGSLNLFISVQQMATDQKCTPSSDSVQKPPGRSNRG